MQVTPKILVFAGSVRTGAYSGMTADAAVKELALQGAEVTRISLADYPMPIMDEDLQDDKGIPPSAMKLGRLIDAHDAVLIASPEYNASIPPLLKNTVDWVSRIREDDGRDLRPWPGKLVGLCSSSNGNFAGVRGLYHLRAVLMNCHAEILTQQCSVARAGSAFNDDGTLKDERTRGLMETLCRVLIERARLLSPRLDP